MMMHHKAEDRKCLNHAAHGTRTGDGQAYIRTVIVLVLIIAAVSACAPGKKIKRGFLPKQTQVAESSDKNIGASLSAKAADFYPMPPEQPRLQLLLSYTRESLKELSGGDTYFLKIERPYDMGAVKGKIYISDRATKKIIAVDLERKALSQIGGDYESAGIWVSGDGYMYAADFHNKQIVVFGPDESIVRVFGEGLGLEKPVDVAVHGNIMYVCDINLHKIIAVDTDSGEVLHEIGGIGTDEGSFYKPTHVIADEEGNLYVNDFFNFRIQKFDSEGNVLKTFGYPGDTLGAFARPKGISVDREGHLYAVDAAFENVQIFDDQTTDLLLFFGGYGLGPGGMYLPNAVYIDYHNVEYFRDHADRNFNIEYIVYVGNTLGPVILNIYGFGEWTGGPLHGNAEK